jgi:hypothetical protein
MYLKGSSDRIGNINLELSDAQFNLKCIWNTRAFKGIDMRKNAEEFGASLLYRPALRPPTNTVEVYATRPVCCSPFKPTRFSRMANIHSDWGRLRLRRKGPSSSPFPLTMPPFALSLPVHRRSTTPEETNGSGWEREMRRCVAWLGRRCTGHSVGRCGVAVAR